jgi:beta-glucosidase
MDRKGGNYMSKKRMKNSKFLAIWVPFLAVAGAAVIAIECTLPSLSTILDTYAGNFWAPLGKGEIVKTQAKGSENWNSKYYTVSYDISTEKNSGSAAAKKNGESVVEEVCDEGMVLLKNKDNALPLSKDNKIALLGRGSVDPVYGGSGSGNVDTTTCANPKSALEKAGFTVDEDVYNFFNSAKDNYARQNISMDNYDNSTFFIGEIKTSDYTFTPVKSETAVVFISRCGGEGLDLSRNMKKDATTTASKKILEANDKTAENAQSEVDNYVDGQHELELSKEEKDMISYAKTNYSKVVIVLNNSTTMEVGDLQDDDGIDGIIWAGSPGVSGFNALGSILAGDVNPSGKTPDLYSRDFTADPTYVNFATNGINEYTGVTDISAGNGGTKAAHFVEYEEGIYVGYRYYETRYGSNENEYNNQVVYPFGYGLSYTTFSKTIKNKNITDDTITVTVEVKNTGKVAGKEAVQLYYTAPYTSGGIEKSSTVLGDYEKTGLIQPGESDTVTLTIDKEDMASYDYNDKDGNGFKGYELEKGTYTLEIKENSHTVSTDENGDKLSFTFTQAETKNYSKRSSDKTEVTNQFDDVSAMFKDTKTEGYATVMSRANFDSTYPTAPTEADAAADKITINGTTVADLLKPYSNVNSDTDTQPTTGADNGLKLIDVRGKDYDDEAYDKLLDQLTDDDYNKAGTYLVNGAYNTPKMDSVNKPATEDHDGPQGFSSLSGSYKNVTAYMSEPLLAATFNKELGKKMGTAIGEESLSMNPTFSGWYGPAMNTHRSPFAGRNFEYYSEDGVLAGKMAAQVVSGAADKGLYAYIKHFALNDQETWRTAALCTWADEQTIREIYLKPFEIVVKTAKTEVDYISDSEGNHSKKTMNACTAVMSSFNRIGTTWAGGSKNLMTNVLRDEWGFRGFGLSDFNLYEYMIPDQGMRAGTDMQLTWMSFKGIENGFYDTTSATARQAIRKAYHNVFYTIANSNAMQDITPGTIITYKTSGWRIMFWIIDGVLLAFVAGGLAWVLVRVLVLSKKYKNEEEVQGE